MEFPVSPIVANLYMDYFEKKALSTTSTSRLWMIYVEDIFIIQQEDQKHTFLEHINKVDPPIKFTVEANQENGAIPFLDTLVKPEADKSFFITAYRKSTHNDQYLQLDSHNNLAASYSVISTLTHRAKTACTGSELLYKEIQHLRRAMSKRKFPKWAFDKVERKLLTAAKTVIPRENPQKRRAATPVVAPQGGTPRRLNTVRLI